jgi:hypothetical protein
LQPRNGVVIASQPLGLASARGPSATSPSAMINGVYTGGYDSAGHYNGTGLYDRNGNYVGSREQAEREERKKKHKKIRPRDLQQLGLASAPGSQSAPSAELTPQQRAIKQASAAQLRRALNDKTLTPAARAQLQQLATKLDGEVNASSSGTVARASGPHKFPHPAQARLEHHSSSTAHHIHHPVRQEE